MKPYWYNLLRHFFNKGYIHNGLTFPYLIGALEVISPNTKLWSVESMLESLNEVGCTILKCPNIQEFVIGLTDSETLKHQQLFHKPCEGILVTDNSLNDINSFDEITNLFIKLYQPLLANKEFSKSQGTWDYFSDIDLKKIKEIDHQ